MVIKPQIQTSCTINVTPIKIVVTFIKHVFVKIVEWTIRNLILPRLLMNYAIFANESEFNLPPPSKGE